MRLSLLGGGAISVCTVEGVGGTIVDGDAAGDGGAKTG